MTVQEQQNTKARILSVASTLFARNGFGATTIREIAHQAEVNVSAVNYHFKSKEALYWRVFESHQDFVRCGIEELGRRDLSTAELAVEVYRFFLTSGSAIMNSFKVMLSDAVTIPEGEEMFQNDEDMGPPGNAVFLEKILQDCGEEVSIESRKWAMKMVFSLIVHFGVVMNSTVMREKCASQPGWDQVEIEKKLFHSVNAHLDYLRAHPRLF